MMQEYKPYTQNTNVFIIPDAFYLSSDEQCCEDIILSFGELTYQRQKKMVRKKLTLSASSITGCLNFVTALGSTCTG